MEERSLDGRSILNSRGRRAGPGSPGGGRKPPERRWSGPSTPPPAVAPAVLPPPAGWSGGVAEPPPPSPDFLFPAPHPSAHLERPAAEAVGGPLEAQLAGGCVELPRGEPASARR